MWRNEKWSAAMVVSLVAASVAMSTLTPSPGAAEGLFGGLFNFLGARPDDRYPAPPAAMTPPLAYADPSQQMPQQTPLNLAPSGPSESFGRSTYCVRLCDGRYFPMSGPAAASSATAVKTCSSMCPASKTAIYHGGKIDDAAAANGDRYADLANAFVYRDHLVADCTCNGKDAFGLAPIDVAKDPTLRPGDVVATAQGLTVFRGAQGETHRTADFTPVNAAKVSAEVRHKLATMRVSSTTQ